MTVREALREGTTRLSAAGAETPYLDATLLLAYCMGTSKEHLFAELLSTVEPAVLGNFRNALSRREQGIPVSYIRRTKEFYGRVFYVDERVLVPRPDTEIAVEAALEIADRRGRAPEAPADAGPATAADAHCDAGPAAPPLRVLDCCTGSGAIAITLAAERPELDVAGSDLSTGAREVFFLNSRRILERELPFYDSDLLAAVPGTWDLIVSNPPYLRTDEVDEMCARNWPEPPEALDGGTDGLDVVRRLAEEALYSLKPCGYLVIEAADDQNMSVRSILETAGYGEVETRLDLAGRRRVVIGRRE